jgi:LmbE family N-acetylglucosaminyl deacetylase
VLDPGDATTAEAWRRHPCWGTVPPLDLTRGEPVTRLVVVAAHPDDETLGAGGLVATAHARGLLVYVVLLTAGESAIRAPGLSRHQLARLRLGEVERALSELAPEAPVVFLGAADGRVPDAEAEVTASLTELVGPGGRTLIAAPWREDGNPDHEAAGRAAAEAARRAGARLAEYPLQGWRSRRPDDLPWDRVRRVDLDPRVVAAKERAIGAHASRARILPHGMRPRVGLPARTLAHFRGGVEHFLVTDVSAADG